MVKLVIISLVFSVIQNFGCWANAQALATPAAECSEAMSQWQSLKYGMFIHYGMNTFTGTELDPGDKPSTTYAPTDLDVDQWIGGNLLLNVPPIRRGRFRKVIFVVCRS